MREGKEIQELRQQPEDLLLHPLMPISMTRDNEEPEAYNLCWKGVRAGFMDRTRSGRWDMLVILEHPDGSVTQHSASYHSIQEALEKLRRWTPTLEGRPVSTEEALNIRAAFGREGNTPGG